MVQRVLTTACRWTPPNPVQHGAGTCLANTRTFFSLPFTHEQLRCARKPVGDPARARRTALASPGRLCASG